jgi:hypothetical protein
MERFNKNDIVIVNDKLGKITNIFNLEHCPVTIYQIQFNDGSKHYHFFSDIKKVK